MLPRFYLLLLALCISTLQAQNPTAGGNTAWQMQQQQMEAQRMFQMQQQMQRNMQMQQQMMMQQRQMQQQMAAQHAAQRARQEAQAELAARRSVALPPTLIAKPTRETWKVTLGQTDIYPAFDGSRLAGVANNPRLLQSLDLTTGKVLWDERLPDKLALDPFFVGDSLIYATKDQQLVALDADTGKERHQLKLDQLDTYLLSNRSAHARVLFPAVDGNRIVLATYGKGKGNPTGWIYLIDLASGQIQWKIEFPGGPDLTPIIKGDRVLIGGGGRVLALNLADGKPIWECPLGGDAEIKDGPLLSDRYVVLCDQKLHAIDVNKGTILWSVPYGGRFFPQGEGERILYTETRGFVFFKEWIVALDAKTGQQVWDLKLGDTRIPWIQDGKVLCNADETFMALDLATGKQLWSHILKKAPALPIAVFGDALYVTNRDGGTCLLQALRLKDGSTAWDYTYPHKNSDGMIFLTPKGLVFPVEDRSLVMLN